MSALRCPHVCRRWQNHRSPAFANFRSACDLTLMSPIEQVANAVLYEGFLLYPYRLSSVKNRHRWNFGVLYPEPFGGLNGERATVQTECLIQAGQDASVSVKIRFLQLTGESPVEREVHASDL